MLKRLAVVLVLALGLTSSALAAPRVLQSSFDPTAGPNEYVVQFPPELGGSTILMPIVGGTFHLEIDEAAGTAKLGAWVQDISPIEIYGMSTGRIQVTMDEGAGSEGTYNPITNEFSVTGTFLISFDDSQLSSVGFISPVALVGTEQGRISGSGSIGKVAMYLEGQGSVAGAIFTYTCRTTARFDYLLADSEAQTGDVNHDRRIDIADPVTMLNGLFLGGTMECPLAADVNADPGVDLADPVFLLAHLYQGGPAPSAAPVSCDPESGG